MKFPGKRLIIEYKNRRARKNAQSLWGDINLKDMVRAVEDDSKEQDEDAAAKKLSRNPMPRQTPGSNTGHPPARATAQPATPSGRILPAVTEPISSRAHSEPFKSRPGKASRVQGNTAATPVPAAPVALEPKSEALLQAQGKQPAGASDMPNTMSEPLSLQPQAKPLKAATAPLAPQKPEETQPPAVEGHEPLAVAAKKKRTRPGFQAITPVDDSPAQSFKRDKATVLPKTDRLGDAGFYRIPTDLSGELAGLEEENHRLRKLLGEQLRTENQRLEKMIRRASKPIEP